MTTVLPPWTRRGILVRRLLRRPYFSDPVRIAWDRFAASRRTAVFVQIGAHDGRRLDPLARWIDRHSGWRGILVEPVPAQYELLQRHRGGDPRLTLVCAAVTDHVGTVEMTIVDPVAELPDGVTLLSSVRRDVVEKHVVALDPTHVRYLQTLEVPAVTFDRLCRDCGVSDLDIVVVDTEGHDATILATIDLDRWRPAVIMFETAHLGEAERDACNRRLQSAGYRLVTNGLDTLARL